MKTLSDEEVHIVEGFRAKALKFKRSSKDLLLPSWFREDNEILRLIALDFIDLFHEMAKMKTNNPKVVWIYQQFPNWKDTIEILQ